MRSLSHFEMQRLTGDGNPAGLPVTCGTVMGILLQCPQNIDIPQVERLCEIARKTPGYPVDLTLWRGKGNDRLMVWSARVWYREKT